MSQDSEITSMSGCLARITWIFGGPVLLLICAVVVASTPNAPFPGILDAVYFGLLAIIVVARRIDRPPKQDMKEYKAGLISVLRYIIILSGSGIMLWAAARFLVKMII